MKKPKAPKLVTVSIFTTVTIIFWVFFSLYNVLVSKSSVDISEKLLDPIDPTLNTAVLDQLPQKVFIDEGNVNFSDYVGSEISPVPVPETEAENETLISEDESATQPEDLESDTETIPTE